MGRMRFAKHTYFIDPPPLISPCLSVGRVDSLPPLDLQLLVGVGICSLPLSSTTSFVLVYFSPDHLP